jgi:hypothetical protein
VSSHRIESETPSKLPLLLAGPILRRVEPSQVCVWIACSKPVSIQAEVFRLKSSPLEKTKFESSDNNKENQSDYKNPIGIGCTKSIRLGENLYVGLVIARPLQSTIDPNSNNFPTDELLAYDIEITHNIDSNTNGYQKKCERLKDLDLLSGKNSIVYNKDNVNGHNDKRDKAIHLPTFFIRRKIGSPLNFLHGSCRKLHGKGEDCLAIADELISDSVNNLDKRPCALFLTGDQIYADDVADPLIQYLAQFGVKLLGWEEQIIGIDRKLTELRIGERQQIVNEYAKFTSENAGNHLLSFGEFAAMYLIAWNIENWPEKYPSEFEKFPQKEQLNIDLQIKQLNRARNVMPAIRRVLANIPTYMICDDHEITDDWNITKEWYEGVKASKCGKQVVANGLAAYWAFQAWGNNPELYNDNFIRFITEYLAKNGNMTTSERNEFEDYLWNFHHWTFDCPTNPSTIFLDCRTQRQFDSFQGPPRLVNEEELQSVLEIVKRINYKKGDPLIFVIPTPVFGFELAEKMQEYLARKSNIYKWDLETWAANERGFVHFLSFIVQNLGPRHCIFLSGDVHYGFTISATFRILSQMHDRSIRNKEQQQVQEYYLSTNIAQLNSSAIKTTGLGKEIVLNEILGRYHQFFTQRHTIRIGWNNISPKTKKLKEKGNELYTIIDGFRHESNVIREEEQQLHPSWPDWIESRSILNTSGSGLSSLIITDNNLGLVSIYGNRYKILSHKLLVREEKKASTKIHETITELGSS